MRIGCFQRSEKRLIESFAFLFVSKRRSEQERARARALKIYSHYPPRCARLIGQAWSVNA